MLGIPADTAAPRRLLGIWAHPDDEAYLSAGLMDRVRRAGGQVTVVTLTDGEAGFGPADPRPVAERSALRRAELREAMAALGVDDVRRFGLPDGGSELWPREYVACVLADLIREVEPEVVVTFGPDGFTGHADHVEASRLATEAWREAGCGELWYAAKTTSWLDEWRDVHDSMGVWMTEEPEGVPDAEIARVVDLSARELRRKRAALAAHASQTSALAAALGERTYRRWVGQETFRRPALVGVS